MDHRKDGLRKATELIRVERGRSVGCQDLQL